MQKISIKSYGEREVYDEALKKLCFVIAGAFHQNKRVLIFLSGGSSVNLYAKLADWIASTKDFGGNLGRSRKQHEQMLHLPRATKERNLNNMDMLFRSVSLAFAQVDERFQPGDQVESRKYNVVSRLNKNINSDAIGESGLWEMCKKLRIPFHLVSQKGSLNEAADEYNQTTEQLLKEYDYKIAVLGIGEDGHTAGLLPGYSQKWYVPRFVAGYENNGKFNKRISLTPQGLMQLDYALIVVLGDKKKIVIQEVLNRNNYDKVNLYPAVVLQKIPNLDLFTDISFGH